MKTKTRRGPVDPSLAPAVKPEPVNDNGTLYGIN